MTPRPTHRRSPVSTASSAASATASPRSDWDGHREQERGQRRFCAPHFLHIAMASFSPCLRTARTRQPCPTVHRLRSGSRKRDPGSFPPDARSSLNPYRSTRQAGPRPAETVSHRRGHGPPHEHPVAPQRPLSAVPPPCHAAHDRRSPLEHCAPRAHRHSASPRGLRRRHDPRAEWAYAMHARYSIRPRPSECSGWPGSGPRSGDGRSRGGCGSGRWVTSSGS